MGIGKQQNDGAGCANAPSRAADAPANVVPLRDFAVALYAEPDVQRSCLEAQDAHGADVNLLLWAAWRASQGRALSAQQVSRADALCEEWRTAVVHPLREQRRRWAGDERRATQYEAIKALELQAEFTQLAMLADVGDAATSPSTAPGTDPAALLATNVSLLCRHWGLPDETLAFVVVAMGATARFDVPEIDARR